VNDLEIQKPFFRAFFRIPVAYNMGGGVEVAMCLLCEQWVSLDRRGSHLLLMHGFQPSEAQVRQVETMHALGADPRDIAAALGARV
jgi:hypothetical protein